jgi:EAL domain-containing protein (putative c-di-GMP-specific phosphodiesterase class I)
VFSINPIRVPHVASPLNNIENAIIKMIIALARAMNIKVIAEGVENEVQLATLESMDCKYVQGYHFGKPMPAEKIESLLIEGLLAEEVSTKVVGSASV